MQNSLNHIWPEKAIIDSDLKCYPGFKLGCHILKYILGGSRNYIEEAVISMYFAVNLL